MANGEGAAAAAALRMGWGAVGIMVRAPQRARLGYILAGGCGAGRGGWPARPGGRVLRLLGPPPCLGKKVVPGRARPRAR